MSQLKRFGYAAAVTIAVAFAAVLYYQMVVLRAVPLAQSMAPNGPFTWILGLLQFVVPAGLGIVLFSTWAWVVVAPVQEEQVEREAGVRRIR